MPAFRTIELSDPRYERDGLRHVTFKSRALAGRADVTLFVPHGPGVSRRRDLPLVILLHGVYGSHWAWSAKAGAHRTAAKLIAAKRIPPMVIAMPSDGLWGDGSGYLAHRAGKPKRDFERFIVDEIPAAAAEATPLVGRDSKVCIAGLSMGGFGALRLAAKYPERFAAASGHSSITDFSQMKLFVEEPLSAYGRLPAGEGSVLHWMVRHQDRLPPIRFDCGTDDPLLEYNRTLHAELDRHGIAHDYAEYPGGHEWAYWEKHLAKTLRFFGKHCE